MGKTRDHDVLRAIDDLLEGAAKLNRIFPDAVLVGGTATAAYARHRLSSDADFILPDLRHRFEDVMSAIDVQDDWETARVKAPVLILGNFHGVETTLRQLIRTRPLETNLVDTAEGPVRIPTLDEMIRVKAWLALTRNAYRDYLDLAALAEVAGPDGLASALSSFDSFYADVDGKGVVKDVSPLLQLTRQLFEPLPADMAKTKEMEHYKGVAPEWADPEVVLLKCRAIGLRAADLAFSPELGVENDLGAVETARSRASGKAVRPVDVPDHPHDTHEAKVSADGCTVVVRQRGGSVRKVDNPLGPAVVSPSGERYALDGRFMDRKEWESVVRQSSDHAPRSP